MIIQFNGRFELRNINENLNKLINFNSNLNKYMNQHFSDSTFGKRIEKHIRKGVLEHLKIFFRDTERTREIADGFRVNVTTALSNKGNQKKTITLSHKILDNPDQVFNWDGTNPKNPSIQFKTSSVKKIIVYNFMQSGRQGYDIIPRFRNIKTRRGMPIFKAGRRGNPNKGKKLIWYSPFEGRFVASLHSTIPEKGGVDFEAEAEFLYNQLIEMEREKVKQKVDEYLRR